MWHDARGTLEQYGQNHPRRLIGTALAGFILVIWSANELHVLHALPRCEQYNMVFFASMNWFGWILLACALLCGLAGLCGSHGNPYAD